MQVSANVEDSAWRVISIQADQARVIGTSTSVIRNAYERLRYLLSYARFVTSSQGRKLPDYDLAFIVPEEARGWILEATCKEIAAHIDLKYGFHYSLRDAPSSKAYFLCHYALLPNFLKCNPKAWGAKVLVFYTHPRPLSSSESELVFALNHVAKVIFMCSEPMRMLRARGLSVAKSICIPGAADPNLFIAHARGGGVVGFSSAYYERKDPDRILRIVKAMPHRSFLLIGKNWPKYPRFHELAKSPNFVYVEAPYRDYPTYYAQMDVFVSPAKLEGGPIPLIESMMCNVVPVASRTGFAPDIISHGENGFLFDTDAPDEEICQLIEQAYRLETDIRETVVHFSWKNFARDIQALLVA